MQREGAQLNIFEQARAAALAALEGTVPGLVEFTNGEQYAITSDDLRSVLAVGDEIIVDGELCRVMPKPVGRVGACVLVVPRPRAADARRRVCVRACVRQARLGSCSKRRGGA